MRHYIPCFIAEKFEHGEFQGGFHAITMFVDISGFTHMTETLMTVGEEGAEILSATLNRLFTEVENAVHGAGGFISTFAGDAFTAIFVSEGRPSTGVDDVFAAAGAIRHVFQVYRQQRTRAGEFGLSARIGLGYGPVEWGIIGGVKKTYYFRGTGIDNAISAEHHAQPGQVLIHSSLAETEAISHLEPVGSGFSHLLDTVRPGSFNTSRLPELKRDTVRHFLPEDILDFDQKGEFRNAASIFIALDNRLAHDELQELSRIIIDRVEAFGGYFNKLDFGDKGGVILVIFGAPVAHENNRNRALNTILAIQQQIAQSPGLNPRQLTIGLSYGTVFAGVVGGQLRCEYTVIGDAVNLAARFMAQAEPGAVWVGAPIWQHLQHIFDFQSIGPVHFKGKSSAISVYRLNSKKLYVEHNFSGKFIGREKEFAVAKTRLNILSQGRMAGLLYVFGTAGVGKSRFIYELQKRYPQYNWLQLPCDDMTRKPFNPFEHLLLLYFNQSLQKPDEANKAEFDRIYAQLITTTVDDRVRHELIRLKSVMAGFLGLHYPGSLYEQLDSKLRYTNTLYAFKEFFKALSRQQPVVLVIEDIHWIDPDSEQALHVLTRSIDPFPILIAGVSRYRDDGSLPTIPLELESSIIDLDLLGETEIRLLTESSLEGTAHPDLLKSLRERTDGNPFFIEQTLLYFKETGIVSPDSHSGAWVLTNKAADMPATITDLLIARIDRLAGDLRDLIRTAAVIGREFDLLLLSRVIRRMSENPAGSDADQLFQTITTLEKQNIWSLVSEMQYMFTHALLRDAVYRMQLLEQRRAMHRLIATTIEQLFPDKADIFDDLAFHYEQAEDWPKAFTYEYRAATHYVNTYKNEKALLLFEKAYVTFGKTYEIDPDHLDSLLNQPHETFPLETLIDILGNIGRLNTLSGNLDNAAHILEKALNLAEKRHITRLLPKIYARIGEMHQIKGNYAAAMQAYKTQLELSQKLNDNLAISLASGGIGQIYLAYGNFSEARAYFNQQLEMAKSIRHHEETSIAYGNLGLLSDMSGKLEEALEYFENKEKICIQYSYQLSLANVLSNKGCVYLAQHNLDEAKTCFENALKISKNIGDKKEYAIAIGNLGEIYNIQEELNQALQCYQEKLIISQELNEQLEVALAKGNLGIVYRKKGEVENAAQCLDSAIEALETLGTKFYLSYFLIEKVEILFQTARFEMAQQLLEIVEKLGREMEQADILERVVKLNDIYESTQKRSKS